jgi:Flp pilus assembly pilin Flp
MQRMKTKLNQLVSRLHHDERGGVSIETVLIIAAIALPILIFLLKVGWPQIQGFFNSGMQQLDPTANTGGAAGS